MIVVDTSALACIFSEEAGADRCSDRLLGDDALLPVSAYVEFLLIRKLGTLARSWIDGLVDGRVVSLAALKPEHGPIAAEAALRYGKGSGHPAQLNFGDCLSYAVAKGHALPLLFVGSDFNQTDIDSALSTEPIR